MTKWNPKTEASEDETLFMLLRDIQACVAPYKTSTVVGALMAVLVRIIVQESRNALEAQRLLATVTRDALVRIRTGFDAIKREKF